LRKNGECRRGNSVFLTREDLVQAIWRGEGVFSGGSFIRKVKFYLRAQRCPTSLQSSLSWGEEGKKKPEVGNFIKMQKKEGKNCIFYYRRRARRTSLMGGKMKPLGGSAFHQY